MEVIKALRLAEMTIQAIENLMNERDSPMSTGMGKLIGIESAISRYNYYKLHPEHIPPYVMEKINLTPTTE